ncbi:DUF167 domain-containing protein [Actinopolymorpha alba]|uniref:DUF167 domain-containing protein n=1 Tax=Actinopolymorpha alba TaxID=533267 RepID=UPI000684243F|nr:DUF167 domain-containing protein [Actinopolymorpha alba]
MDTPQRIAVRVKPGARRARVGGRYAGRNGPALVVAVNAPPVDGRATEAVRVALAQAFGVSIREISLVSGARSRDKIFEVVAPDVTARLESLLDADGDDAKPANGASDLKVR